MHTLRDLIIFLLCLLVPLALLMGGVCSLHSWGYVDVGPCAPLTGVYQVKVDVSQVTHLFSVTYRCETYQTIAEF